MTSDNDRPRATDTAARPPFSARIVEHLRNLGPGLLVAAAFLGPGTVTTASTAGADSGFQLVWAVVFGTLAAIVLQEMSARLGVVAGEGLGEALRTTFDNAAMKAVAAVLVISAIGIGGAAFETGNITGAAIGLESLAAGPQAVWAIVISAVTAALLWSGVYKAIERLLIALVVLMSVVFLVTAVIVRPDVTELLAGFAPTLPSGAVLTVVALVGTTVVPYNFFLHASSVREKWDRSVPTDRALAGARFDTVFSIGLGGLITLAVLTTAAAAFFGTGTSITDAGTMAEQLEPALGPAAKYFFALGLLAAGLSSAVTAPLASSYAICGVLGWRQDLKAPRFRAIWIATLVVGLAFTLLGGSPVQAIVFAQATNGVLLPIVAAFLLVVMNRSDLLGTHANTTVANVLGGIVVLVAAGLGAASLIDVARTISGG
jgi:manganese transport protein